MTKMKQSDITAFPNNSDLVGHHLGMDLLDYFAAHSDPTNMIEGLSHTEAAILIGEPVPEQGVENFLDFAIKVVAYFRYEMAQAMVNERNRRLEENS